LSLLDDGDECFADPAVLSDPHLLSSLFEDVTSDELTAAADAVVARLAAAAATVSDNGGCSICYFCRF
jgi:hypothetical protein